MSNKQLIIVGVIIILMAPAILVAGFTGGAMWPVHPGVDGYVPPFVGLLVSLPFAIISAVAGVLVLLRARNRA